MDLLCAPVRLGPGEIDLVEDGDDLEPRVEREQQVRDRLRLHALRGIHDENRPLARVERAGDLVGKVHVARRVDEVQLVHPTVGGAVLHAHGVQLDGDAALALQVHRVEHLLAHQPLVQRPGQLDEPIGEGRFPMIDMGHDAEIADVILSHAALNIVIGCR